MNLEQGFPNLSLHIIDRDGRLTQPWYRFFIALWDRTGRSQGTTPDDILTVSILESDVAGAAETLIDDLATIQQFDSETVLSDSSSDSTDGTVAFLADSVDAADSVLIDQGALLALEISDTDDQSIILTSDVTGSGTGSITTTIAKIQGTTVSGVTGTGNVVFSNSPILVTPALGTPASGVLTNCTGMAAGLTAGTVTTNANLTGVVTSVGNATSFANVPFSKIVFQKFTGGAGTFTYTPTANMLYCTVRGVGSGGGGGGGTSASGQGGGGGGGAGEYGEAVFTAATIGASKSVVIGAVGSGGATSASSPASAGTAASTSTFGSTLMSLAGGGGGSAGQNNSSAAGGSGGNAGGTASISAGGDGISGTGIGGGFPSGGTGGASIFGTGGAGGTGGANPRAGVAWGSGGGGGQNTQNGAAGAAGAFLITEYCSS